MLLTLLYVHDYSNSYIIGNYYIWLEEKTKILSLSYGLRLQSITSMRAELFSEFRNSTDALITWQVLIDTGI